MKYLICVISAVLAIHLSGIFCFANKGDGNLAGRISAGFMVINSSDNLVPDSSEEYLDSLNSGAEKKSSYLPVILGKATWDVGEKEGVKLFFDTDSPIDKAGSFVFNLGGSFSSPGSTIYLISAFASPFGEVWKNPYLTGARREETDTTKYGVKLAVNRIMGSGFRINFVYLHDDVDDDEIGTLIPDMARDGAVYAVTGNYSYYHSKSLEIRPQLSLRLGEYDGESNSFMKYKTSLEARYMEGRFLVAPEVFYSYTDYEEVDRIFDTSREDESYGITLKANYMAPFGFEKYSIMVLTGYSRGESNIDFYDAEGENFGLFLNYNF